MRRNLFLAPFVICIFSLFIMLSCSKKEGPTTASVPKSPPPAQMSKSDLLRMTQAAKGVVVARVNGDIISMDQLLAAMNALGPKYLKPGQKHTPEIDEMVRKEALENLISEELAFQEAIRRGLKVKPAVVDDEIARIRAQAGSDTAYREYLGSHGMTEADLRSRIERNLTIQAVMEKEILSKVERMKPVEKRIREVYDREKSTFYMPDHIIGKEVFIPKGNDEEAARKKAEQVLAKIRTNHGSMDSLGADPLYIVRDLAVTKSEAPVAYAAISPLAAGEVSGIIKAPDGFHIVKIVKKTPSHQLSFEEAKGMILDRMMREEAEKAKKEWEERLRKKAKIEILAEQSKDVLPVN